MRTPLLERLFTEIEEELGRAKRKHPNSPTLHHALSVIREEYLELEREVYINNKSLPAIYKEAIQVATSAIRLIMDPLHDSRES